MSVTYTAKIGLVDHDLTDFCTACSDDAATDCNDTDYCAADSYTENPGVGMSFYFSNLDDFVTAYGGTYYKSLFCVQSSLSCVGFYSDGTSR